jgi:hypothetical protein
MTRTKVVLICFTLAWAVGVACSAQFPLWVAVIGAGLLCAAAVAEWPDKNWVIPIVGIVFGVYVWLKGDVRFGPLITAYSFLGITQWLAASARRGGPPPAPRTSD